MRPTLLAFASLSVTTFAVGCSGDDGGDPMEVDCALETRDDDFVIGLTKPGDSELLSFQIMEADPLARFENRWVVQINQGSTPVTDATLTVTSYMPDHGHVSPIETQITSMPTAGQYELEPIYFSMPSLWEVTIEADSSAGQDSVVFRVCVPR
jgi:hypothetical protein